jgi:hypothetical protein
MMGRFEKYFKQVTWLLSAVMLAALVAGCGGHENSAPTISTTSSANNATDVPTNSTLSVTFSEAMAPATINAATFLVTGSGGAPVAGNVTYLGTTATFTPTAAAGFAPNTAFTARITTGATDLSGKALASDYVWTFVTGAAADTSAPAVSVTTPGSGATGVPTNSKLIASFNKPMNSTTVTSTTFVVTGPGAVAVAGAVAYAGNAATFTPSALLAPNTLYSATITTGAKDLAGNALASDVVWSFTTGAATDTLPPTVSSESPLNHAVAVTTTSKISVIFSETMDPATITTANFKVAGPNATTVSGTVAYSGTTATFTPNPPTDLASGSTFTATISSGAQGVKDLAGNALASDFVWSFTTGAAAAKGPAAVNLGRAGNFVILAKTGISTVPTSAITGDIAVSPAAASLITGFGLIADSTNVFSTCTQVIGKVYAANYAVPTPNNLTTAVGDMGTAYTDAAGRLTPDFTELYSGAIGGKTLFPGLYKWGTGVSINSDVTLSGGPNDVWIFQIAGDITQAAATQVKLAGGALPKNIFWQVAGGTGVAIGTTAHFEGVILAQKAITLNTGASINGRLLAQSEVTLKSNTVTQPAP